ncbi:MAG: Tail Collar domain protein [Hymenobacter sp.]|nr:Tail Collar domain protein [Hymenobacter sp.]
MKLSLHPQGQAPAQQSSADMAAEPTRRSWLKRLGALIGGGLLAGPALAKAEPASPRGVLADGAYVGEIMLFAGNFAVQNFAFCNGQLLSIAQNTALFSILGTTYGGDGRVTFALPDLRSRVPMHFGQGPGLSNYDLGQNGGSESVTLLNSQLPSHAHAETLVASTAAATSGDPTGLALAVPSGLDVNNDPVSVKSYGPNTPAATSATSNTGASGGGQPAVTIPPYLALNYQICLNGIFPPR